MFGVAVGMLDLPRLIGDRIEHGHHVGALLGRSVDQAVGVDARIALVGGDRIVQIRLGSGPLPHADHDVALDALRPLRLGGRQFAGGDAVGPVREQRQRFLADRAGRASSPCWTGLTGLQALRPGLDRIVEMPPCLRNRADALASPAHGRTGTNS